MNVLFLDESGDHNLSVIDPSYPLFVLGGVIMDSDYARDVLTPRMAQFKRQLFGREDIVLHTADITRNRNGFERLKDSGFRVEFYTRLNALMRDLEYRVVACAIRKDEHLSRYGMAALDPYLMSLDILVERFCMDIGDVEDGGVIVPWPDTGSRTGTGVVEPENSGYPLHAGQTGGAPYPESQSEKQGHQLRRLAACRSGGDAHRAQGTRETGERGLRNRRKPFPAEPPRQNRRVWASGITQMKKG